MNPIRPLSNRTPKKSNRTLLPPATLLLVSVVSLMVFVVALCQLGFSLIQDDCPISVRQIANVWKENELLGSFHVEGFFRISNRSKVPVRIHGLWSDCNCLGKWFELKTVPPQGHLDLSINTDRSSISQEILSLSAFTAEHKTTIIWKLDPNSDLLLRRQAD